MHGSLSTNPVRHTISVFALLLLSACSNGSNTTAANGAETPLAPPADTTGASTLATESDYAVAPFSLRMGVDLEVDVHQPLLLAAELIWQDSPAAATATDAIRPTYQWHQFAGPGSALFSAADSINTEVRFDQSGTYLLSLTVSAGTHTISDSLLVEVMAPIAVNRPPQMEIAAPTRLQLGEPAQLQATLDDDGLPSSTLEIEWSQLSGPGTAVFSDSRASRTEVTFDSAGSWVLQALASDGEFNDIDQFEITVLASAQGSGELDGEWQTVTSSDGSRAQARHEAGAVAWRNQLLLMGGRGSRRVELYNPAVEQWSDLGTPAEELHHFQPVLYDQKVYVIGALGCCYPDEPTWDHIRIFDPATRKWSKGDPFPAARRRGSAGSIERNGKIYIVGGNTRGHSGGMVAWFDEYDPATGDWKTLPDAPHARDHFQAVIIDDKLIAAGGRRSAYPNTMGDLVAPVDIYDFDTGRWSTAESIPTPRAGAMNVAWGDEVIVIGGETDSGAHDEVEAFSIRERRWRSLDSLQKARHSGGAVVIDDAIHVVAGNLGRGGGNESSHHECLDSH